MREVERGVHRSGGLACLWNQNIPRRRWGLQVSCIFFPGKERYIVYIGLVVMLVCETKKSLDFFFCILSVVKLGSHFVLNTQICSVNSVLTDHFNFQV